jgi:hypothetical protein
MATLKKKTNYVPKRNIKSITVKRGNKTTEIDGKNLFDGAYVKKGVKFKDGGSMKVGDKKVYNKLVGRKGNEYYFLNYVFKHENDFMGAVGTIVTPVNKEYYEYATSRDGLAERFLNAMSESEWCNTLGLDEDNCTEEEIIDGIENLYRVGELQPFEECNSTQESQMREIAQFSDSNEYPLFEVIGGGRSFDKNQKFDKVYDKGLLELIKKAESNKLAKGGSMYRTGGVAGSKHVDVTKGYRLEHGYKAIKGDDKNKDYSKGKAKVKVTRGYRLPSGYEVREGAYNKKYEDGGNANCYCYEIGGL